MEKKYHVIGAEKVAVGAHALKDIFRKYKINTKEYCEKAEEGDTKSVKEKESKINFYAGDGIDYGDGSTDYGSQQTKIKQNKTDTLCGKYGKITGEK